MEAFRSLALQPAAALLLDDEVALTENVAEALTAAGHEIITSRTGEEALGQRRRLEAAVVDYHLPDATGIEVARRLRARDPGIRILFISGFVDELRAQLSSDLAGSELMEKPLAIPDVIAWLERAGKPGLARAAGSVNMNVAFLVMPDASATASICAIDVVDLHRRLGLGVLGDAGRLRIGRDLEWWVVASSSSPPIAARSGGSHRGDRTSAPCPSPRARRQRPCRRRERRRGCSSCTD